MKKIIKQKTVKDNRPWSNHYDLEAWINGRGLVSPLTRNLIEDPITEDEDEDNDS